MGSKSSIIYTLTTLAMAIAPAFVHAGSLPPLINFQSVLLDEGGNLLPSGPTTVQFQILDENQAPIYSETQSVDVVKGAVAALIGNGTDSQGTTTGGIPDDIFAGGAPRYLQVQVGSHAPEEPMTIVPVPYAQWSQTCATVADGSIKANAIAKAAVGFEALAPDVVSQLANEMSKSQGVVTTQTLGATGGATQIGVEAKFINSGSSSVQGVLQDIDLSVKKSQEMDTFLKGKLNQEVTDRTNAVKGIQEQLDMTAQSTMKTAISNLQGTTSNINNIPGQLKLDRLEASSSAISDLNMGGKKITNLGEPSATTDASTKNYVDVADGKLQNQVNTINTTISNINNIPGTLDKSKLPPDPALSPIAPVLTGEIKASDISAGMKFIPFMPEELGTNCGGDTSGHVCVNATIAADNKLYYCKIGIKYSQGSHGFPSGQQPYPTCDYTVIPKISSQMDDDGPNMDIALQRGIVVRLLNSASNSAVTILYSVYEVPVATQ